MSKEKLKQKYINESSFSDELKRLGYKEAVDKACEWLKHQEEMIGVSFEDDFIERFKKAMEE